MAGRANVGGHQNVHRGEDHSAWIAVDVEAEQGALRQSCGLDQSAIGVESREHDAERHKQLTGSDELHRMNRIVVGGAEVCDGTRLLVAFDLYAQWVARLDQKNVAG